MHKDGLSKKRRLKSGHGQTKLRSGVPRFRPPRPEPNCRHEKVGDKGREIQDHAITGATRPQVLPPIHTLLQPPYSLTDLETIIYVSGTVRSHNRR